MISIARPQYAGRPATPARTIDTSAPDYSLLRDYQKTGVDALREHRSFLLADEMRLGKAQALNAPVLTPTGWQPIGSLHVGDLVIGSMGTPVRVIGVFPQGALATFAVHLTDGARVTCSDEHLWLVQNANDRFRGSAGRVKTTRELRSAPLSKESQGRINRCWFIPVVQPVRFTSRDLAVDPYLIGALAANGSFGKSIRHHGTEEQRTELRALVEAWGLDFELGSSPHTATLAGKAGKPNPIHAPLRALGLMGTVCESKFLPPEYLLASVEQRTALLCGLLDNDGTCAPNGETIEYNTISPRLARDVLDLVRSLGGSAWASLRVPTFMYKGERKSGQVDHRIRMSLPADVIPFRVPSKLERYKRRSIKFPPAHAIESIDPLGVEECVCIRVDAPDSLYVAEDYVLTHNTAQALRALPRRARAIVVSPTSVIGVWEDQVARWRPDLSATSGEELRKPRAGEVLIISRDSLPPPAPGSVRLVLDDLSDVRLIADEVHGFMTEQAQRTRRFRMLAAQCHSRWGLSGTPMPGAPLQLWGVLCSLGCAHLFSRGMTDKEDRPMGARETFVTMCGGRKKFIQKNGRLKQIGYEWGKVSPEVRAIVETIMLRRLAKDLLSLPPKQYQDVRVQAPADLTQHLDEVKAKWEGLDPDDMPPFELLSEARKGLARSRIPAALEFAQEAAKSMPLLVFSAHREPVVAFKDVPGAGWFVGGACSHKSRDEAVRAFQAGELSILAMTIEVGGVGLDLSKADGMLFVDQEWNPGDNLQAEARASAVGKTSSIMIWRMISDHPIETRLRQIHETKLRLQGALGV